MIPALTNPDAAALVAEGFELVAKGIRLQIASKPDGVRRLHHGEPGFRATAEYIREHRPDWAFKQGRVWMIKVAGFEAWCRSKPRKSKPAPVADTNSCASLMGLKPAK